MNLALFDFDGTLTTKDSLGEFLKYKISKSQYSLNMMRFLPYFLLWQSRIISNSKAKEKLFSIFYKGMDEAEFKKRSFGFSMEILDNIIHHERFVAMKKHKQMGDRVVVVSASMQCWLQPWCEKNSVELLCTELEFKDGKFTGRFATKNCHGIEKVNRINALLNPKIYPTVYAYGDSSGDDAMLELAHIATKF